MSATRHTDSKVSSRLVRLLPYFGVVLGLAIIAFYPASEAIDAWRLEKNPIHHDKTTATNPTSHNEKLQTQ